MTAVLDVVQYWISFALAITAVGIELYALVDCLRRRSDAFTAAGKRSKGFWLLLTALAAVVGLLGLQAAFFGAGLASFGLFAIIAIVIAGVYLADVKPALDQVMGRGSSSGPYGPW